METAQINPVMENILEHLDETEPRTIYDVADRVGATYWTLYPNFRKLEELGLVSPGLYSKEKKKTYIKADLSKTPKFKFQGPDGPVTNLWRVAQIDGANIPVSKGIQRIPALFEAIYTVAARANYGYDFDRQGFMLCRGELINLRNQLENYYLAIKSLLEHPIMQGDADILTKTLMHDPAIELMWDKNTNTVKELGK